VLDDLIARTKARQEAQAQEEADPEAQETPEP
jgi:hypothetical protein